MEKLLSIVILIFKKWKKSEQTYCDWIMRYILWLSESTAYPRDQILEGSLGLRAYGSAMKILLPTGKIAPVRR